MTKKKNTSSDILSSIAQAVSSVLTIVPLPSEKDKEKEIEETPQRVKTAIRTSKKTGPALRAKVAKAVKPAMKSKSPQAPPKTKAIAKKSNQKKS